MPPSGPAVRRATYQDVIDAPADMVAEILDGELVLSPRPAARHTVAASGLGSVLSERFGRGRGGPGGWWILFEPELHFEQDVLVPDLSGWRRDRMPRVPDVAYFELAPDWVCEVLSPKSARLDRIRKMRIYARNRIPWCWLVDPLEQFVEVYRLDGESWVRDSVHGADEVARARPFDACELDLLDLWGEQREGGGAAGA